MSTGPQIIVLADDLTGAAEIAAAGYAHGFESLVETGSPAPGLAGELMVHDTDTRLLQPADAARKIVAVSSRCGIAEAARHGAFIFKKTDSVLRGPVVAEIEALSAITRHARTLLVAGNPRLGRLVRDGRLFVGERPIHESVFASDPHHPARTSMVADLLGPARRGPVHVLKPGRPFPNHGLIIGEMGSDDDLEYWAACVEPDMLVAGSSVFFEALLAARGRARRLTNEDPFEPHGILVISGTTAQATRKLLSAPPKQGATPRLCVPAFPMPSIAAASTGADAQKALAGWTNDILVALAQRGAAAALAPPDALDEPAAPARIRSVFASLAGDLHASSTFRHLVIEGGSTAASIVHRLHWNTLRVLGEPAPGVATLAPETEPAYRVTVKPGTYPWPEHWIDAIAAAC